MDKLNHIDEKIDRLKKQREKMKIQQAILFMREAQRIFPDGFSPGIALCILSDTWSAASESEKQEWQKRGQTFRAPIQKTRQKSQTLEPTHQQS